MIRRESVNLLLTSLPVKNTLRNANYWKDFSFYLTHTGPLSNYFANGGIFGTKKKIATRHCELTLRGRNQHAELLAEMLRS